MNKKNPPGENSFDRKVGKVEENMVDRIALILAIIGGINWGSVGLFKFDIVAWICGGQGSLVARIIYTVVGLASIWCVSLLFRNTDESAESYTR